MLVRLFGVKLSLSEGLTVPELWEYMDLIDGNVFASHGLERIAYFETVGKYCVALILTIKDTKRWLEMTREGKKATIHPEEVAEGRSMIEFNFLALHKETGRGLYQHYWGSMSIPKLSSVLWNQNRGLVEMKRKEWLEEVGETPENTKKSKLMHGGQGVLAALIRDEEMPRLLKKLDVIESFAVDYAGLKGAPGSFKGLGQHVKSSRYRMTFSAKLKGRTVADQIMSFWNNNKDELEGARVEGMQGEVHHVYDLEDLPAATFGQFDFDDATAERFDSEDFTTAPMLKRIIGILNDNKNSFHVPEDEV